MARSQPISTSLRLLYALDATLFIVPDQRDGMESVVLIRSAIRLLEVLFFAGAIGSLVVVLFATVEDVRMLFEKDGE